MEQRGREEVVVIGGVTVDIDGVAKGELLPRTSNPGKITISHGGVGRNIAENLVRLGIGVQLLTAVGQDAFGRQALHECEQLGIGIAHAKMLPGFATSMYVALHDAAGEMALAVSQLDAVEAVDSDSIRQAATAIEKAPLAVLDTNLCQESIQFVLTRFRDTPFFVDPVSVSKARKIKPYLRHCHTIKPNKDEAEVLTDMRIRTASDLQKATSRLLAVGLRRIFISLGAEGVFYRDEHTFGKLPAPAIRTVSDTGAGDAFMAGLVYSHLNNYDILQSAKLATAAAGLALSHKRTVHPDLTIDSLKERMQQCP